MSCNKCVSLSAAEGQACSPGTGLLCSALPDKCEVLQPQGCRARAWAARVAVVQAANWLALLMPRRADAVLPPLGASFHPLGLQVTPTGIVTKPQVPHRNK